MFSGPQLLAAAVGLRGSPVTWALNLVGTGHPHSQGAALDSWLNICPGGHFVSLVQGRPMHTPCSLCTGGMESQWGDGSTRGQI